MKEAKEFLLEQIYDLAESFPIMEFKYEFNNRSFTHIVEATPLEQFEDNLNYLEAENELVSLFEDLYVNENLLFVSEHSLNRVNNPEFIVSPKEKAFYSNHNVASKFVEETIRETCFQPEENNDLAMAA